MMMQWHLLVKNNLSDNAPTHGQKVDTMLTDCVEKYEDLLSASCRRVKEVVGDGELNLRQLSTVKLNTLSSWQKMVAP